MHLWEQRQLRLAATAAPDEAPTAEQRLTVSYRGQSYAYRSGMETYLLMGLDTYEQPDAEPDAYNNPQQADFLFLLMVDRARGEYGALHVNRDSMAEITRLGLGGMEVGSFTGQLALAHTYGSGERDSCRNTVKAVSGYLYGVPIDHYASITMEAVPVLNDLVGGVVVPIEDDFSRVDPSLILGTEQRLQGEQALTYVRARGHVADSTNLNRMRRQRAFISAFHRQSLEKIRADEGFSLEAALSVADYMVSDLTAFELADLANSLSELRFTEIYTIEGEARQGQRFMEFYADEDALRAQLIALLFAPVSA